MRGGEKSPLATKKHSQASEGAFLVRGRRVVDKFLFRPLTINGETRYFGWVKIIESYEVDHEGVYSWKNAGFYKGKLYEKEEEEDGN